VLLCVTRAPGTVVLAGWSWPPPPLELVGRLVADDPASSTDCEWGDEAANENRALTPVLVADGSVLGVVYKSKASPMQSLFAHSCCSRRNPRSVYPRSNDDDALAALYLLRTSFFGLTMVNGGKRQSGA
jgi:hypothetical protein